MGNTIKTVFEQESGIYDLDLSYFVNARTDGQIRILINGVEVSVLEADGSGGRWWQWSRQTASVEGLELRTGDVIEIVTDSDSGPQPFLRSFDFETVSVFDKPALGEELIFNGGFEDHAELPYDTRWGEWGILDNDDVPGWFAETVDRTVTLDFEGLSAGDRANGFYAAEGVRIKAEAYRDGDSDWNDDMIFDATSPTGGDYDLGIASAQGNILIISEDSDASDPDDAAAGGWIRVEFDDPTNVVSFKIIDNESYGSFARLYDDDGDLIRTVYLPRTSNGGVALAEIDTDNVSRMDIRLKGSGAIDDIVIGERVDGAIEIQEGRVFGAPRNAEDNAVLELDSTENARISQNVQIADAGSYRLTFDYAARGFRSSTREDSSGVIVLVNGVEVFRETTREFGYKPFALTLDLDAGTNTISFQGIGRSDGIGALIDNVSLRQILDPSGNGAPVAPPFDAGAFAEDGSAIVIDLLQNASDPDMDALTVESVTIVASDGRTVPFSLDASGSVITIPRDGFNDLAASQPLDLTINYVVSDGTADVPTSARLRIDGANDAPEVDVTASQVSGSVMELEDGDPGENSDDLTANGAVVFSDADILDTHTVQVTPQGNDYLGTFVVGDPTTTNTTTDGSVAWTFTVNDQTLDDLGATDTLTQVYDIAISDGQGGTVLQSVTVDINGAEDPPPPPTPTLDLATSDETADNTTEASVVTLIGVTGPNLTVELLDSDGTTVLATALSNADGEFRLPGISLELGVNSLSVRATDPDTGLSSTSPEIDFTRDAPAPGAPVNAALFWNAVALDVIESSSSTPDYGSRALAMESHAVFNAIAAIDGTNGYQFNATPVAGADANAAISHAAYTVLSYLFPGQSDILDQALADALAGITSGLTEGETLGRAIADQIIDLRDGDGWDNPIVEVGSNESEVWRPTGPDFVQGLNPQWAELTPFALNSGSQFRPDAPPSLLDDTITTDAFANDLERVRALGDSDSTQRTADQTEIARFWADGAGTETPPGHWNTIASDAVQSQGLGLSQSAELLLQLNLALADAAIAAWDTKYTYDFWRPITILTQGGVIDGSAIDPETDWAPLVSTPNHPEYVSGHSTYSGAAATILTSFFGDNFAFDSTADTVAGSITRSFSSFWDAANEAGESRIFGGIHFDFSNLTGLDLGSDVANWILQSFDPANDVTPPRITLDQSDGFVVGSSPTLTGFLTDNLSGAVELRIGLDGLNLQDVVPDATGAFTFLASLFEDGTADGQHFVDLVARDAAGNTTLASIDFILATQAPEIVLTAESLSGSNSELGQGSRLIGDIDVIDGNDIASLTYSIDGGVEVPIAFDAEGQFDVELDIAALTAGAHTVTLSVTDLAGNTSEEVIGATLATQVPLTITQLLPENLESGVGVTFRPLIEFSREIDLSTLTDNSFFATDSTGAKIPARIVPLANGKGAWLFFDDALPGGSAIALNVIGDLITDLSGALLDADADGSAGGTTSTRFTTVSNTPIPGTTLTGLVLDPGDDLFPMTPDDFIVSPNGATDWDGHTYLNPIANAEVYILGRENEKVFTDAEGRFTLTDVPAGNIKVVVDGRTATNAPDGLYFPEMVIDVLIRPGVENTIMSGMGSSDAQIARIGNDAFYLPRIEEASLIALSETDPTIIKPTTAAGTSLTPDQFDLISLTVQPGSLVDAHGDPVANPEIGLTIVPSPLVIDMLPEGMPVPPIFLTIQGPDGGVFTEEAVLTLPNVFGLAPGEKTEFFSYDHTTGLLVVNGNGTVSEDGLSITTDPGSGILQPGWNGAPPALSRIGIDPNIPCPPGTGPDHTTTADGSPALDAANNIIGLRGAVANTVDLVGGGSPGGLADDVLGPTGTALALRDDSNRIQNTLNIMANAWYAGETGPIGGQPDAGFWALASAQLLGDVSRTAVHTFSGIVTNLPFFEGTPLEKAGKGLDAAITAGDSVAAWSTGQSALQPTIDYATRAKADAQNAQANGIPGKVTVAEAARFSEVEAKADALLDRIDVAEMRVDQIAEQLDIIEDNARILQTLIDNFQPDQPLGDLDPLDLVGPENAGDEIDSPFFDAIRDIVDAAITATQIGNILAEIEAVEQAYNDLQQTYNENFGDSLESILASDALSGDPEVSGGLDYEFLYGPIFYGTLVNLDTGESEQFTFNPASGYDRVVDPLTNYQVTIYDPVSGQVSSATFTSVVAGAPGLQLNPLMGADAGTVGPGGLTELAALAVGADFTVADSLLPGTGISDRQALASGLAGSPQLINVSGVTGIAEPEGTAEAVTIGGTTGNGGGMVAFVATGDYGLAIVDVAQTGLPVIIGQIDLPGFASDVAVDMNAELAAVAGGAGGLTVVDFSDAANPSVVYTLSDILTSQVEIVGDRVIAGSEGRIFLIDLASGTTVDSVGLGVGPTQLIVALAVEGTKVYALGDNQTLYIVETANDSLSVLGSLDLSAELNGASAHSILAADGVAWIGAGDPGNEGGLVTVDISDTANPTLISGVDDVSIAGGPVALNGSGFGISAQFVDTNPSGIPSRINTLDVFDSSDPSDTSGLFSRFTLPGELNDVAIAAGTAFVAAGSAGLQVVNYLGFDVSGNAPTLNVTQLPGDADPVAAGLQLFEGEAASFGIAVSDDIQVRSVELLIDGAVILSRVTYPWDLNIQLPTIEDNGGVDAVSVEIRATDTGGNATTSAPIDIQLISNTTPFEIVDITPDDGADVLFGESVITVSLSKPVELTSVNTSTFTLMDMLGQTVAPSAIQTRDDGREVQLTFAPGVLVADSYTLTIDAENVFDRSGTALGLAPITSEFEVIVIGGQTWISPTSGTWNDPLNWSTGAVPAPGDDVVLPLSAGVIATINEDGGTVNSVTVSGDGEFRVQAASQSITVLQTSQFTNSGNVDVNFGSIDVNGGTNNSGTLTVSGRGTYYTTGNILNSGIIAITNSGTEFATFKTEAPLIELTGGGTIDFDDASANGRATLFGSDTVIESGGGLEETFVNVDNTIKGTGSIGLGFELVNGADGEFIAEDGDALTINTGRFDNNGLVQAMTGGTIVFDSDQLLSAPPFAIRIPTRIDNADGTIWGAGGQVRLGDSFVIGGSLLSSSPGGSFGNITIAGGTLDGTTSQIFAGANLTTFGESFLQGDINNIQFFFAGNPGILDNGVFTVVDNGAYSISANTTLTGGGSINLQRNATAQANGFDAFLTTEINEEIFDGNGDQIGTTGFTLTLADQNVVGRGTIGTSFQDPVLDELDDQSFAPRLDLDLLANGEVDANDSTDSLTINNVDLSNLGQLTASNSGVLEIVDSNIDNQGLIWAQSGSVEFREDGVFGTNDMFTSSGEIRASSGSDISFFTDLTNTGMINLFDGGSAFVGDDVFIGGSGSIDLGSMAVLEFALGADTENTIDFRSGDAQLLLQDSSVFTGLLREFETGDEITLSDVDQSVGLTLNFNELGGGFGVLDIDDGNVFTSLTFQDPTGFGFGPDPLSHFFFDEADNGGTLVTTDFNFA